MWRRSLLDFRIARFHMLRVSPPATGGRGRFGQLDERIGTTVIVKCSAVLDGDVGLTFCNAQLLADGGEAQPLDFTQLEGLQSILWAGGRLEKIDRHGDRFKLLDDRAVTQTGQRGPGLRRQKSYQVQLELGSAERM